jgi:hypothetical protein
MKRTSLKQIGKIGRINMVANEHLTEMFVDQGINACEVRLPGCLIQSFLDPAHRHRRWWYRSRPKLLYSYDQVICACRRCHTKIDQNKELLEKVFDHLRGPEKLV